MGRVVRSQCPNPVRCSAANPTQYELDADQLRKAGLNDEWISAAMRCGYCGLVYSVEFEPGRPPAKVPRGYFDKELMLPGHWRPLSAHLQLPNVT